MSPWKSWSLKCACESSRLSPCIDLQFSVEDGVYPAFNKAMHAVFGDESTGIKIKECGSPIHFVFAREKSGNWVMSPYVYLVKLWIEALSDGAKAVVDSYGMFFIELCSWEYIFYVFQLSHLRSIGDLLENKNRINSRTFATLSVLQMLVVQIVNPPKRQPELGW